MVQFWPNKTGDSLRASLAGQVVKGFSPVHNLEKILKVSSEGDQTLRVLNGVRVLSICYVVYGHTFAFVNTRPVMNVTTARDHILTSPLSPLIPGGFFAVDAFFFLSGFLTFALLCQKMVPVGGRGSFVLIYLH